MWQEQGEARGLPPLGQPGDDELVDDDLRPVDEVAVLRLPQHQRLRRGGGVAVLEAEAGVLGERAVVQFEARPGAGEMLDRDVGRPGLGVVQRQVALAEGAAHGVLAGQPDRAALEEEGPEGQRLGVRPFDSRLRVVERGQPAIELLGQLGVDREALRRGQQGAIHGAQHLGLDGGRRLGRLLRRDSLGAAVKRRLRMPPAHGGLTRGQVLGDVPGPAIGLFGGDDTGLHQARLITLAHAGMRGDGGVLARLRVGGLVSLVVPVAPIAHQVDHDVAVEPGPVHPGQAGGGKAGLGIIRVDVDDRRVEALGEVAGVDRRACLGRLGGEADLVVGDQVQGAAGPIPGQAGHVERFGHHALGGEGRVAVDQDRDRSVRIHGRHRGAPIRLLGAGVALDHRIDGLEVARVGRDGDPHRGAICRGEGPVRAEVVLHVVEPALRNEAIAPTPACLELDEDRLVAHPDDVGEDVQAATMRHPDHGIRGPGRSGTGQQGVEHRHHRVEALDAEPLLAQVGLVQEALQPLHPRQPLEQRPPLVRAHLRPMRPRLDRLPQPDALVVAGDVLDLVGNRAAVGRPQERERLGQGPARHADPQQVRRDPGHGVIGEAQRLGIQRRVAHRLAAQRVEPGRQMPEGPIRPDQRHAGGHGAQVIAARSRGRGEGWGRGRLGHRCQPQRLVEAIRPLEERIDATEEGTGLGSLDDPMVVGRADGHHAGCPNRPNRPRGEDRALAGHEPRDRCGRAQGPRVGERDRGPGHVVR